MELPKIDNSNLWDKTYMILKERIIRREFKPNQKLLLPELSEQLGVSRTPIRDALNRLEMDGLVRTVSKVGTFVSAINKMDVLDIIDTRLMLELWVVQKLPRLEESELKHKSKQLAAILDEAENSILALTLEEFLKSDYNLQFHMEFLRAGNNKRILDIYLSMMNYHYLAAEQSLFTKEMVQSAINQHREIVLALEKRNFAKVADCIRLHLEDSKERLLQRLEVCGGQI